jgi:fructose-1,6-bisphosphatase I
MTDKYGIETDSMTLQRFVLQEQKKHPSASGDLTTLLTSLLTAVKVSICEIFEINSRN